MSRFPSGANHGQEPTGNLVSPDVTSTFFAGGSRRRRSRAHQAPALSSSRRRTLYTHAGVKCAVGRQLHFLADAHNTRGPSAKCRSESGHSLVGGWTQTAVIPPPGTHGGRARYSLQLDVFTQGAGYTAVALDRKSPRRGEAVQHKAARSRQGDHRALHGGGCARRVRGSHHPRNRCTPAVAVAIEARW